MPQTEEICGDNLDNNCNGQTDEDVVDKVTLSSSSVVPLKTSGKTQAEIKVSLARPATKGGCTVDLKVYPVPYSGGHNHHDVLRPHGKLNGKDSETVNFYSGETSQTVKYTSSEIAGKEEIIAKIDGKEVGKVSIDVKVPGLEPMPAYTLIYQLTGGGDRMPHHSDNHYGTKSTRENMILVARDFYKQFKAKLGINDMSLVWGGLFDLCDTWNPADRCSLAPNRGHFSHRKGTSVDIDRNALSQNGYIRVNRGYIEDRCRYHGKGWLVPEATIHCEFPY
ncbi:MAG: hypothetical protein HY805_00990 [Nitrospirae bacterium]|nr:hypothetical protein [Nitrospirota bacterium]